jgi:hypothetical protein
MLSWAGPSKQAPFYYSLFYLSFFLLFSFWFEKRFRFEKPEEGSSSRRRALWNRASSRTIAFLTRFEVLPQSYSTANRGMPTRHHRTWHAGRHGMTQLRRWRSERAMSTGCDPLPLFSGHGGRTGGGGSDGHKNAKRRD